MDRPVDEPVFQEPWHAQVFAITLELSRSGLMTWPDWTERFGAMLKAHGLSKELDGGDDYFLAWLDALESLLKEHHVTRDGELFSTVQAWRQAFETTPHGQPVTLSG